MGTTLRDYQRAALDALPGWFAANKTGNPLIVVPTGGGKSVIISELIRETHASWPDERIMVVTHVKELIDQNHRALLRSWPEAPAGIYSAGLKRREARSKILFAGVQSVYAKAREIGHVDLVLVDEAHLIPSRGFGMYRQLLQELTEINPAMRMIGFTATPFRTDSGVLHDGDGRLFHGIAYDCSLPQLIEDGWLSPVRNRAPEGEIDTSAVGHRAGDFVQAELEEAARRPGLIDQQMDEVVRLAGDRKAWLVFCSGLDHAMEVEESLRRRGIHAESVFGHTDYDDRDRIIDAFRARQLRCIVNVGVLTTGFDAPHVDLIVLLRPTESPGLYVQMVGRGLRKADGKTDCLVLDFGGNLMRHGPIDAVVVKQPKQGDGTGDAPAKKCPECGEVVAAGIRICLGCGHQFPVKEIDEKLSPRPDQESDLVRGAAAAIERWQVRDVQLRPWISKKGLRTLRVDYDCGIARRISEWVCFEHPPTSYPRRKATEWWISRGGSAPAPETVDLAMVRAELREIWHPAQLVVDTRGEYPEIKGTSGRLVRWDEEAGWRADEKDASVTPAQPVDLDAFKDLPF